MKHTFLKLQLQLFIMAHSSRVEASAVLLLFNAWMTWFSEITGADGMKESQELITPICVL